MMNSDRVLYPPRRSACRLRQNPLPIGWGDHVRWMHETENWHRAAGPRHVEARAGAAAMRSRAYAKLPVAWRLTSGAHPVERKLGMPTPPPTYATRIVAT